MNLIVQPPANGDFTAALVWLVIHRQYRRAQPLNDAWETALEDIEAMPRRFSPVGNSPPGREFRECYIPPPAIPRDL